MNKLVILSMAKIKQALQVHTSGQEHTCTSELLLVYTQDLVKKGHILQLGTILAKYNAIDNKSQEALLYQATSLWSLKVT